VISAKWIIPGYLQKSPGRRKKRYKQLVGCESGVSAARVAKFIKGVLLKLFQSNSGASTLAGLRTDSAVLSFLAKWPIRVS
jgi:hypothetical protein